LQAVVVALPLMVNTETAVLVAVLVGLEQQLDLRLLYKIT